MSFTTIKHKNKVRAFTLSEMLVVLLLTVIVVGLAFTILNLVQKQMWGIQEVYEHKTINDRLKQALWIDFSSHQRVYWTSSEGELLFENELERTMYTFKERYVLKDRDTFFTEVAPKALYFNGNKVSEGKVDAIELSTAIESIGPDFFIFKRNAASNYME